MEQILSPFNAEKALRAVEGNQGAPGIDGMRTEQLQEHLRKHGEGIRAKLMAGTYVPAQSSKGAWRLAPGQNRQPADGPEQPNPAPLWLPGSLRPCDDDVKAPL